MRFKRMVASAALVLAAVLLFSVLSLSEMAAMLFAIVAHELGHVLVILAQGQKITGIYPEMCGFKIVYQGKESPGLNICAALAGPMFGFLYAFLAEGLGKQCGYKVFLLSARISIIYSVFNLLPVKPLDGGRIFQTICSANDRGEELSNLLSCCLCLVLLAFGLLWMLEGKGNGLFAAALWCVLLQSQNGVL